MIDTRLPPQFYARLVNYAGPASAARMLRVCRRLHAVLMPHIWRTIPAEVLAGDECRALKLIERQGHHVYIVDVSDVSIRISDNIAHAILRYCPNTTCLIIGDAIVPDVLMPRSNRFTAAFPRLEMLNLLGNEALTVADLDTIVALVRHGTLNDLRIGEFRRLFNSTELVAFSHGLAGLKHCDFLMDRVHPGNAVLGQALAPTVETMRIEWLWQDCVAPLNQLLFRSNSGIDGFNAGEPGLGISRTFPRLCKLDIAVCCTGCAPSCDYAQWQPAEMFPVLQHLTLRTTSSRCCEQGEVPAVRAMFANKWPTLTGLSLLFDVTPELLIDIVGKTSKLEQLEAFIWEDYRESAQPEWSDIACEETIPDSAVSI